MNQIQWFPGHMAKARGQVEAKLSLVDIVYELRDARAPEASANPMLAEIILGKPRLIVLNKADLADPATTEAYIRAYTAKGLNVLTTNSLTGNPLRDVLTYTERILAPLREKESQKGMRPRHFRAMVLGIPNVGKSQFINRLAGKAKAKTGDIPGITKGQTYLRAGTDLELLDNPGILWPKFDDHETGLKLALIGSVKDSVYVNDEVVIYGLDFLARKYPLNLMSRYDLDRNDITDPIRMLDTIGKKLGCLLPGGIIDYERVHKRFLHDFRNQMFGRVSLEEPR